jgi:hypothetical protein
VSRSFVHSLGCSFVRSCVRSFVRSVGHSFVPSFRSVVRSFDDSFVSSFLRLFFRCCDDYSLFVSSLFVCYIMSESLSKASKNGRNVIIGGDFNAIVGKRERGDAHQTIGQYGLGDRNRRGRMLMEWAHMNDMNITNTRFQKPVSKTWTHNHAGKVRQIDYILIPICS